VPKCGAFPKHLLPGTVEFASRCIVYIASIGHGKAGPRPRNPNISPTQKKQWDGSATKKEDNKIEGESRPSLWGSLFVGYNNLVNRGAVQAVILMLFVSPVWTQTGRVLIRVTDPSGSVIPAADVSLLGANNQPIRTVAADNAGESVWTDLNLGDSRFRVSEPGFISRVLTVATSNGEKQDIEARLELDAKAMLCILTFPPIPIVQTMNPDSTQPKSAKHRWWQIFR
jgi:Carboxypeptidase regulatory-like domain